MYKHVLYILLKLGNCVWYRASIRHVYVRRMLGTIWDCTRNGSNDYCTRYGSKD